MIVRVFVLAAPRLVNEWAVPRDMEVVRLVNEGRPPRIGHPRRGRYVWMGTRGRVQHEMIAFFGPPPW